MPFIIGLAGSVAVGKSTTARILQALLSRWPNHPSVDLVTTDGFLFPNAVLESRGLMKRKGFPESYDRARLVRFLADVKAGLPEVHAPVYSHQRYDIVPGHVQTVRQPDIVIVEGLNVLQAPPHQRDTDQLFASDFFDFSIYVDADERDIEQWYVARFLRLVETVFQDPDSYFHRYASLDVQQARETAAKIWSEINAPNLRENIQPTRMRAHLILTKGATPRRRTRATASRLISLTLDFECRAPSASAAYPTVERVPTDRACRTVRELPDLRGRFLARIFRRRQRRRAEGHGDGEHRQRDQRVLQPRQAEQAGIDRAERAEHRKAEPERTRHGGKRGRTKEGGWRTEGGTRTEGQDRGSDRFKV